MKKHLYLSLIGLLSTIIIILTLYYNRRLDQVADSLLYNAYQSYRAGCIESGGRGEMVCTMLAKEHQKKLAKFLNLLEER